MRRAIFGYRSVLLVLLAVGLSGCLGGQGGNVAVVDLNRIFAASPLAGKQMDQAAVARFRQEIEPIAKAVAEEQGFDVVLTMNRQVVFVVASGADITPEVLARYQGK